ncbi:ABC transporter substrate-binding protein [Bauldia litoralis]|uniref:Multiple sugar transport system substrate-binding protein n=1 Tax=Bauldia litoralis TaxID=665467 RepID=A0A1G6EMI0_9HYPH|nr:multiple sugar transport system substrate-binding protein [Bauldia litoralis]
MSKLKLAVIGGALALSALTANAALADITILAWPGGPEETALRKIVDNYNAIEDNDSKASLLFFSRDNFFDKMLADAAAGSKEFDVMLTTTYSVGQYASFMVPIDDLVTEEVKATFPQSALDSQSFEGHLYGIPTDLSVNFIYYRTDLFEQLMSDAAWQEKYTEIANAELGKDLEPKMPADWTWDDFVASALFFTKSINPDSPTRYGAALQMKNIIFSVMIWQTSAAGYGGNWMDADGNITVDSDAYRQALDIYKTIAEKGATPGGSASFEYSEANGAFGTGQVAFTLQWSAAYSELIDAEAYPQIEGKFDITHPAAGPAGVKTHFHALGLGVNKASEKQDEAKKFLAYLASEPVMTQYGKEGGKPPLSPALTEAYAGGRPDVLKMGEYASDYGVVMNGATSSKALAVYNVMAENFTGYWSGTIDQDTAIANVVAAMEEDFGK